MNYSDAPWLSSYGDRKFNLQYPDLSISDKVLQTADECAKTTALSYMGRNITYATLKRKILETAKAFVALGVKAGDKVTICLPNVPQAVYALYALNYIGAIASMIHPLSAEGEIEFYLNAVKSTHCLTLDMFEHKFKNVLPKTSVETLIVGGVDDELSPVKKIIYKNFLKDKKLKSIKTEGKNLRWQDFISNGKSATLVPAHKKSDDVAVILFSGGTTGVTKGILLSNLNFNALALQTAEMANYPVRGSKMLAAMPVFHGFGLGVCIHTMMVAGGTSILVPQFNPKSYCELIIKNRPNFIAGVPTLYEAITRGKYLDGIDLSCLKGVFSGGDSLSIELKKKFDKFLADHNCSVRIREGYGTTECVTASCLTPVSKEKEGSIGIPYPDTYYMICKPDTNEPAAFGEDGEICLRGPSVMKGYLDNEEETAKTLRVHEDGHIWLHTGDMGYMDEEGFIYFKQRMKRMIITSGYNVYPSQLENIIDAHEAVKMSCVIGVKDDYKMQKIKAFVVLKEGVEKSEEVLESIWAHCRKNIAKYALPYEIEIRTELPKTLVGKIAYTVLEKEENEKLANKN